MKVLGAQLCPTLCDLPDSSVHRILQARILERVAIPFSRGSSQLRDRTRVFCIAGGFFTSWATRGHVPETMLNDQEMLPHLVLPQTYESESEVAQSCPTLCNPVDCSPPGSSVHGILQARILEWVAISFSRGSSQLRDRTQVSHITGRHFNLWAAREAWGSIYYLPISDEETEG